MKLTETQAIDIFKALSDPNRMQIFQLLLHSDRTNSELMDQTGLRQNLLSHHLNILTECGLIGVQRSIGDARRHYYTPEFRIVRAIRDWWADRTIPDISALPALKRPVRVLFLCRRNGARSFMAEALARKFAADALIVDSAGSEPFAPDEEIGRRILAEQGIVLDGFAPKAYQTLTNKSFDYIVSVCDIVHERDLPTEFPDATIVHWSLPDPLEPGDEAERLANTREVYDEIARRLANFVQQLVLIEASAGDE